MTGQAKPRILIPLEVGNRFIFQNFQKKGGVMQMCRLFFSAFIFFSAFWPKGLPISHPMSNRQLISAIFNI
ncbi:MAG: hypothetical protein B6244_07645 [Candidatus Cloacimonetes bacterium 4572_55]|nr:MAG: hypothetical protein B6244_07645 [Candidatus Cloacimonetes bacterium 4572_55]